MVKPLIIKQIMGTICRMKFMILAALALYADQAIGQKAVKPVPDGNYYIVRHAEKDTGNNPGLTAAGYLRAGDLYRTLRNKKISRIYVTQYRRTQLTADSIRIYQKIEPVQYSADDTGDDLFLKLSGIKRDIILKNNVLIVGHSNTIPAILKRLGITALDIHDIPDNEYDNLFVVTIKNGKASLKWLNYGKASQPATSTGKMKPLQ